VAAPEPVGNPRDLVAVGVLTTALLYRRIAAVGKIAVSLWIGTLLTVAVVVFPDHFIFNSKIAFDFPPKAFNSPWLLPRVGGSGAGWDLRLSRVLRRLLRRR